MNVNTSFLKLEKWKWTDDAFPLLKMGTSVYQYSLSTTYFEYFFIIYLVRGQIKLSPSVRDSIIFSKKKTKEDIRYLLIRAVKKS